MHPGRPVRVAALAGLFALVCRSGTVSANQTKAGVLADVLAGSYTGVPYDSRERPGLARRDACLAEADEVTVQMDVENVISLDQKAGSYTLEGYLRISWEDWRLTYNHTTCGLDEIVLTNHEPETHRSFWAPDVYFEHSVDTKLGDP